jgi:hypothetical protein
MNTAAATFSIAQKPNAARGILWGGLVAGVLDITAAFVVYGLMGVKPVPLLQGIASGLLGSLAFSGGLATALLGLLCHLFIAFSAAAAYFVLSRKAPVLVQHPVVSGVLYGPAVYFFMQYVVLPLSAVSRGPFSLELMAIGIVIHVLCVGLPIAIAVRRFSLD